MSCQQIWKSASCPKYSDLTALKYKFKAMLLEKQRILDKNRLCFILRYVSYDEGKHLHKPFNRAIYGYVLDDKERHKY